MQEKAERVLALTGALSILALMFLTSADVIGRYVFNSPVAGTLEISSYLLIGIVFLAVAYVQSVKGHINVDLFEKRLSARMRAVSDIFGSVIGLAFISVVTWRTGIMAWKAWDSHDYSWGIIQIPLWPVKTGLALGVALLCTRLILDIFRDAASLRGNKNEP